MQTKLEKRLKHLDTPAPSPNLRERCLNTIPVATTTHNSESQKTKRPFKLQRVAIAGAFLFGAAVGIAFLNTRPPSDGKTVSSGSVAFAQILEAARRVEFVHAKGRAVSIRWYSSDWSRAQAWFDAEKGLYTEESSIETPSPSLRLAKGTSAVSRRLLLADGTLYDRSATSSTLRIQSKPEVWKRVQSSVAALLMGVGTMGAGAGNPIGFNDHQEPQLLSSSEANWKEQKTRLLIFEGKPSREDADRGAPTVQAHFYVNPNTNLVAARQDYAVSDNESPRLVAEYEFDYIRPNPTTFDPTPLKVGADVSEGKNP